MGSQFDFPEAADTVFHAPLFNPSPPEAALKYQYLGRKLKDVQAPAVVIDVAVARRNCNLMLETVEKLGVSFRAHVKTHKTTQLTKLQIGGKTKTVKLVASTPAEIENLLPWLLECKSNGRQVNVAYGIPVAKSAIPRLGAVARILGENSISLFVDHPDHVRMLDSIPANAWPGKIPVFVKVDVGYHRAGVTAGSGTLGDLAYALKASTRTSTTGFYAHLGSSYSAGNPQEALRFFSDELRGLEEGAMDFLKCVGVGQSKDANAAKVVLSLGASPTATATQNIVHGNTEDAREYRALIDRVKQSFDLELHAGVYPLMDMQQLATRARPQHSFSNSSQSMLSFADLGLHTLVEVVSVYNDREKPEAMVAAGSIVLGREPCKSYPGWGVVTAWPEKEGQIYDPETDKTGWIVGRISQEHGVLTWEGPQDRFRRLEIGQKLKVVPNHACMNGPSFGWYLIVDSDQSDAEEIVDVWPRWRG